MLEIIINKAILFGSIWKNFRELLDSSCYQFQIKLFEICDALVIYFHSFKLEELRCLLTAKNTCSYLTRKYSEQNCFQEDSENNPCDNVWITI